MYIEELICNVHVFKFIHFLTDRWQEIPHNVGLLSVNVAIAFVLAIGK